jgi:hypothetical protein
VVGAYRNPKPFAMMTDNSHSSVTKLAFLVVTIGKVMPEGVWLMLIETLNELSKIRTFTQMPTGDSMNGAKVRGWYVKLDRTQEKENGNPSMVTDNQLQ